MQPFENLRATAAVLLRDNIDTDQIIPGKELMKTTKTGFGAGLFSEWRYLQDRVENPAFELNQPRYKDAQILVTGRNFGCGSSREAAAWAVRDYGFTCVIARSFSGIFYSNCIKNGVLPISLNVEAHSSLVLALDDDTRPLEVDLRECRIESATGSQWSFSLPAVHRELLMLGLDGIEYAATYQSQIDDFRAADRLRRPWVYLEQPGNFSA